MKTSDYKVLITTSGVGSRLGEATQYTNKALIAIGPKPVISYIIEAYPKETRFVITLGHFGRLVKDYLRIAYPQRSFTFVEVDPHQGRGSSLGFSMLQAEKNLQEPFIYHASDTIVKQRIPAPQKNWIGGFAGQGSSNYTSFNLLNGKIQKIMDKGILDPDYLHIGLVGVYDFRKFWKSLKKLYKNNTFKESLSDYHVLNDLIEDGTDINIQEFTTWYDTGNTEPLIKARQELGGSFYNLDKLDESIFIIDNKKVIKFYSDGSLVRQRVERAKVLKGLVPKIQLSSENFMSYSFIRGDLFADVANPVNFVKFMYWSFKNLWKPVGEVSYREFRSRCRDFYFNKTNDRISQFFKKKKIKDSENVINGLKVPKVSKMIDQIDFGWLSDAEQSNFHGDFILDNIIKTRNGFCLLDWRPNFGGLLKAGDIYYDLAKLNHNLIINHSVISRNLFEVRISGENINCDLLVKENLLQCQNVLFDFLSRKGYDLKKIKLLTSLVWFRSAPLHHEPYDSFLFYFAKLNLWRILNNKQL